MKKLFLLSILVGITFLSCSDNTDNGIVSSNNYTEQSSPGHIYEARLINGEIGGELILNETYIDTDGRETTVYARLHVFKNSFPGTINITMVPDVENLSVQLSPEMTFSRDVRFDLSFKGVGLQNYGYTTSGNVEFAFFADDGEVELIETEISQVNIPQDKISVHNAKLNHFSRYGWIR